MKETWKDIKGYEGLYQCSTYGNVRSLDRYVYELSGKKQFRKGQIIVPRKNKNGYLQLTLNKNAKRKMVYVHRIVADAYSARTAHPFQRNGAPFRFKLSKAQQVD